MALFRRPKKVVRPRVIIMNEEDDGDMDDTPIIIEPSSKPDEGHKNGTAKSSAKSDKSDGLKTSKKKEKSSKQTLLSFDDDEVDESEVFKVKKSSVSRRLIRQRDKEKRDEGKPKSEGSTEYEQAKKEGAAFMRILNGREAEAVHMEEEDDEDEETETPSSVKFRSTSQRDTASEAVRIALERGEIPDAKLIHEARKRRMMARQFDSGAPGFIPVPDNTQRLRPNESRLVRDDDENDKSGDDDEERIDFSTATNAAKIDREKRREVFDAAQQQRDEYRGHTSEDDSEDHEEEWEKQQIRKAVSHSQMKSAVQEMQQHHGYKGTDPSDFIDLTYPSYSSPTEPIKKSIPKARLMNKDEIMGGKAKVSLDSIISSLNDRLTRVSVNSDGQEGEISRMENELSLLDQELEQARAAKPGLASRYVLYQNLRGYVLDLVDCLRCKVPAIDSLESKLLDLMESRAKRLCTRRREDMKDQLEEVKASFTILAGAPVTIAPPSVNEAKSRRAAEREGRRTRRRRMREIKNIQGHREGLSSDDEETELESNAYKLQRDAIVQEAEELFEDVVEDFGTIEGILARFEEWRDVDFDAYKESFAYVCLPKCLSPLLRAKLLSWDPLVDGFNLAKFSWFRSLVLHGTGSSVECMKDDPDTRLVPEVVEKIVLPWITKVVLHKWDPLSASQTKKLIYVTRTCIDEWTIVATGKPVQQLLSTVIDKLKDAIDSDVYIPLFPKPQMANKCSPAYVFASRQFWTSVKLLDNLSSWSGLLSDKPLHTLALDALLTRSILVGLRTAPDLADSIDRARGIVNVLPRAWLLREDGKETLNGMLQLTSCLVSLVQNSEINATTHKSTIAEVVSVLRSIGATVEADLVHQKYS